MRQKFLNDVRALAAKALAHGATRLSHSRIEWDISGDCSDSFRTENFARPSRSKWGHPTVTVEPRNGEIPLEVVILTRCHKCTNCLKTRQREWSWKTEMETRAAHRTWFGTLTLTPDAHYRALLQASAKAGIGGVEFDTLEPRDRFKRIEAEIWPELKLMLMRIRSAYGHPYRYVVVVEAHKSGLPHYHLLVHEVTANEPLKYSHLDGQWKLGFSKFRLVKSASEARYVCKYLSKSSLARVRPSLNYGYHSSLDVVSQQET